MNNILLFLMIILCYGCFNNEIKEIYVVYDDSYTGFRGTYFFGKEYEVIKKGYELVLKDPPAYKYIWRVYRRPFNRRYWFIGKFLIDKENNISFIPVTSSKGFKEKKYKKEDIERIKDWCFFADSSARHVKKTYRSYHYYDLKEKKFMVLTEDNSKYDDYIIYGFADYMPRYLVIKNEYGKRLMENGIILPDPNELKDNIVWQDWYNYWGLTDYKIEIP